MFNGIIGKLNDLVDNITGGWLNLTEGKRKRPADNYSGFLWLVGATLLLVDIFIKNLPVLIVGLVMILYGIIRCFSGLGFHDSENRLFEGMCSGIVNGFKSLGSSFAKGAKGIKDADKTKHFRGVKNKMSEASERRKAKAERKRAEEALKREEEEAAWEARNLALAEYRARHAANNQGNDSGNVTAPKTNTTASASVSKPEPVAAKPVEPAVSASAPVSKPEPVVVKPTEPVAESTPVSKPEPVVSKPAEPTVTVSTPVSKPETIKTGVQSITRIMPKEEQPKVEAKPEVKADVKPEVQPKAKAETTDDEPRLEQRIGDKRYYIFECPGCSQNVRIPNRGKKGKVAIVCPGCSTRFVKNRW